MAELIGREEAGEEATQPDKPRRPRVTKPRTPAEDQAAGKEDHEAPATAD